MCCWFLLRVRILCVHCYCFGILIAHLWASAYPNGSLDIYVVRVILFFLHVCVYGFLLCFWRQQVTVHMHKKRYMCVIHSWCVWVVIHVCCTLIEMCLLVYPVNLCVHICVQRMFWFTSICAYIQDGGCSIFVHAYIEGLYMSPHPSLHVVCTHIHVCVLCTLRMYMHERVRTP